MTLSLFSLALLAACSSTPASPKKPASPASALPSTQSKPASFDSLELPVSEKKDLSLALIEADNKWHIWMEGRSGVIHSKNQNIFWLGNGGVALPQGKGQYNIEVDGHSYYTTQKLSTMSLKQKFEKIPENKTSIKIVLEMTNKGKYITQVKPPTGHSSRLSVSDKKPTKSAIITVENKAEQFGKAQPKLTGEAVVEAKAKGIPTSAKALKVENPPLETLKKWQDAFQSLFDTPQVFSYSTLINLDGDEAKEGFFCTKVPRGHGCFVVDTFAEQERFYSIGFNWKPKEPIYLFSTEQGTYIGHQQKISKTSITKILRFDGSGYTAERL